MFNEMSVFIRVGSTGSTPVLYHFPLRRRLPHLRHTSETTKTSRRLTPSGRLSFL
jgi:hypothetical protein